MHRQILGLEHGDPRQGDHVEPAETLNNTDGNLRIATRRQQMFNTRIRRNNKTGFKGVIFYKPTGRYRAQIRADGKKLHLGFFDTPEEAYQVYCAAAIKYHGEFARTL